MKEITKRSVGLLVLFLLAGVTEAAEIAQIRAEHVRLAHVDSSSADFELELSGVATKSVTVRSIFFQEVFVNGIPLRIAPIMGPLKMKEGQDLGEIPVLKATLPFREMPSLAPLRELILNGTAHVRVVALVQIEPNLLQMVLLRSTSAWAAVKLDQDSEVDLPGGVLTRAAALAALTAAEPVWILGNAGLEWRRDRSEFAAHATDALAKPVVLITCNYQIQSHHGELTSLHSQSLGMVLPSGRILTTAEATTPWMFEPALAEALSRREVKLLEDSVEVLVKPLDRTNAFSSRRDEVRVISKKPKSVHMVATQEEAAYRLRLRETDDNAVLLEVVGFQGTGVSSRKGEVADEGDWQSAAVLRTELNSQAAPSVWLTEIRKENGRWVLKDPAGVTALGSPVWTENGFAGLLQNDNSAGALRSLLKSFPSEVF